MHSERDIQMLTNVRKYLIDISKRVYRDYKFFFQAENKKQRRDIYNHVVVIDDSYSSYPVVCKSYCDMVMKDLVSMYGYDVSVISCDNDEFGHCDILVSGDQKYIINCLSDLELNQFGMRSHRFASLEYCLERYSNLLECDNIGHLSADEVKGIDETIGYFNGMYFDDVIDCLAKEFGNFKLYLKSDAGLRNLLIGDVDCDYIDSLSVLELLKVKFKFLCNYFNGRQDIVGHIELIRIYKLLMKKFFSCQELKYIKWSNCFFDKENSCVDFSIFNTSSDRVRFISFEVDDMVYLISTVSNEFVYMSSSEWESFKLNNNVLVNSISGSGDSISEVLRNKGIGVNIMKHSVVKKMLNDIEDCIFFGKSDSYKKCVLDDVCKQGKKVVLRDDFNNEYCIFLDNFFIKITINHDSYIYYYIDDDLVLSGYDETVVFKWKDEGVYGQCVRRKDCGKKLSK